VSGQVRPGPAVSGNLCPIRARVRVSDGRLTAVRPPAFRSLLATEAGDVLCSRGPRPAQGYARGSGRRSFLVRRCLGDNCQSSAQTGPVESRQLRLVRRSVECGLVGCSRAWWNDRQNDQQCKLGWWVQEERTAPTSRVGVGWYEVRRSRAGGSWKLGRRTLPWNLVCNIEFGHEFWTPLTALAAGEWDFAETYV
jgi:hypothetical protein